MRSASAARRAGAGDAGLLDRILAVPQPSRIDEQDRQAVEVAPDLDRVARGSGDRRHDRDVATREGVEEGGFAGIGRSGDDDREPLAQALAARLVEHRADAGVDSPDPAERVILQTGRDVAFVGEIEGRFEKRQRLRAGSPATPRPWSPRAPASWRKAWRRCASVSASIRSARPSTRLRSMRPFRKARRVNSPGGRAGTRPDPTGRERAPPASPIRHGCGVRPGPPR